MKKVKIDLSISKELSANIKRIGGNMPEAVEAATVAGADVIFDQASSDAPGDGLGVVQELTDKTDDSATVGVGADKRHFYYNIIESGRVSYQIQPSAADALLIDDEFAANADIPARAADPWLRPALDENVDAIIEEMGAAFWDAIMESIR